MASEVEKLGDELLQLVAPLEADALEAVVELVRTVVSGQNAALDAKRAAQALAAEAFIRS